MKNFKPLFAKKEKKNQKYFHPKNLVYFSDFVVILKFFFKLSNGLCLTKMENAALKKININSYINI